MKVIIIIDNFIDEREFRNYCAYWLSKQGFKNIIIDDARLSDSDPINNNDFTATKNNIKYTIQTFLNKDITEKEVNETIEDMLKEKVDNGIIITNKNVSDKFREYAKEKSIEIIDKEEFTEEL